MPFHWSEGKKKRETEEKWSTLKVWTWKLCQAGILNPNTDIILHNSHFPWTLYVVEEYEACISCLEKKYIYKIENVIRGKEMCEYNECGEQNIFYYYFNHYHYYYYFVLLRYIAHSKWFPGHYNIPSSLLPLSLLGFSPLLSSPPLHN